MTFKKSKLRLLVILLLGLILYKPATSYYAHHRDCSEETEHREFYEAAYDDLYEASKRMAILVDLYKLSPSDLPASSKVEASDYVTLFKFIIDTSSKIAFPTEESLHPSVHTDALIAKIRSDEAEMADDIKSLESCSNYSNSLSKVCSKIIDAKIKAKLAYRDLEWPACKDNASDANKTLIDLMKSTRPILRGAMKIKGHNPD